MVVMLSLQVIMSIVWTKGNKMNKAEKIFTTIIAILVIVMFVLLTLSAHKIDKTNDKETACENSGGRAIVTRYKVDCVDDLKQNG